MIAVSPKEWEAFYGSQLQGFRRLNEKQAQARCPFHDDGTASLSINVQEGLWKCHGCGKEGNSIGFADAKGIRRESLPGWEPRREAATINATYDYMDEGGTLLYQAVRFEPKSFRQRRPDGAGGWSWELNGTRRVPYRLPELLDAKAAGSAVFVAEGEKDVESLRSHGFVATCNPMGAGKWRAEYSEALAGFEEVVIIADRDEPGRKHAQQVAQSLYGKVKRVKVLELPGERVKDASDFFQAGGTDESLAQAVLSAPLWTPQNSSLQISPLYTVKRETNSPGMESVPMALFMASGDAEVSWQIEGLLPCEAVGILAGTSGYGKSWMLLDLAIECAKGGKWLGNFPTRQGRVFYVDEESAPTLVRKRLRKLLRGKGLTGEEIDLHFAVGQGLSFSDPLSVQRLRAKMDELKPALLIIDTLIRVFRGEENSASDMSEVFAEVKKIVRDYQCAILFADHQKKIGNVALSADQLLRGSSEKTAFVDTLLSLQKKDDTLFVEHSKSRFAEAVPAFAVKIEDDAEKTKTTVRYLGEAEPLRQAARLDPAFAYLTSQLSNSDFVSRQDLLERGKDRELSERVIDEALKAWVELGKLEKDRRKPDGGASGGKRDYYRLRGLLGELDSSLHVSPPIVEKRETIPPPVQEVPEALLRAFPGARIRPPEGAAVNG